MRRPSSKATAARTANDKASSIETFCGEVEKLWGWRFFERKMLVSICYHIPRTLLLYISAIKVYDMSLIRRSPKVLSFAGAVRNEAYA